MVFSSSNFQVFVNVIIFTLDEFSYPKGLIVAFALKRAGGSKEQNCTREPTNDNADVGKTDKDIDSKETEDKDSENINTDEENSGEKIEKESEEKESEDKEKSSEGCDLKGEGNTSDEQKPVAATYKDNMDVVMREDLKSVFQKFGTVKVPCYKLFIMFG